jgi:hypothetical protein
MRSRNLRLLLSFFSFVLLGLAGVACAAGASVPAPLPEETQASIPVTVPSQAAAPTEEMPTPAGSMPTPGEELPTQLGQPTAPPEQLPTQLPAIPERRHLTLEWPPTIRSGDSDVVRLTLEVDAQGNLTPTAEIAGHQTRGQTVEIPNLYATHRVFAEARLDMAGMQVVPAEISSQALLPGQAVTFYWSVKPQGENTYRGQVWFYLRFIPLNGGAESQRVISSQLIEIRSVNFIGLSGLPARILGVLGTLVGSIFSLDSLFAFIWKRVRKEAQ